MNSNPTHVPVSKVTAQGIFALGVVAIGAGALMGSVVGYVSFLISFYFIVAIPFIVAMASNWLLQKTAISTKVRSVPVVMAAAVLMGLSTYLSMRYVDYQLNYWDAVRQLEQEVLSEVEDSDEIDPAELQAYVVGIVDEILVDEVGQSGFIGYVLFEAKEGIEIGKPGRQGVNIGTYGTWLLWAVELGILVGYPLYYAKDMANKPFCEAHDSWFTDGAVVCVIAPEKQKEAIEFTVNAKWKDLAGLETKELLPFPNVQVSILKCPQSDCQSSMPVIQTVMIAVDAHGNKQPRKLAENTIDPRDVDVFGKKASE